MLYLDDIQHTHPELLQKFISLCDGQRRIEGVWKGRTKTHDLRGKKFCVVMAGNPVHRDGRALHHPGHAREPRGHLQPGRHPRREAGRSSTLSFVENALTSNAVVAPLAMHDRKLTHQLIRMAQGGEGSVEALSGTWSSVEIQEMVAVLQRLLRVQRTSGPGERRVHRLGRAGRALPHRASVQAPGQLPQHVQGRRAGRLGDDRRRAGGAARRPLSRRGADADHGGREQPAQARRAAGEAHPGGVRALGGDQAWVRPRGTPGRRRRGSGHPRDHRALLRRRSAHQHPRRAAGRVPASAAPAARDRARADGPRSSRDWMRCSRRSSGWPRPPPRVRPPRPVAPRRCRSPRRSSSRRRRSWSWDRTWRSWGRCSRH